MLSQFFYMAAYNIPSGVAACMDGIIYEAHGRKLLELERYNIRYIIYMEYYTEFLTENLWNNGRFDGKSLLFTENL